MKIFIAYATIEGQSRKIAERLAATIDGNGHQAMVASAEDMPQQPMEEPDGIILCAAIHAARYQSTFTDFIRREINWLQSVPSAMVSVTLSIASDDIRERADAARYPATLAAETGWTPRSVHNAAGALRYAEYDYFKRWMLKRIAPRNNMPGRPTHDYELTDWPSLNTFAIEFLETCAASASARSQPW
jgi:menaquinone-dependent protoporphyrinogen oxidase